MNFKFNIKDHVQTILWVVIAALLVAMLFARAVYPEFLGLTIAIGIPLVVAMIVLIRKNQQALKSRTAAYGLNSAITILLVFGLLGIGNFLVLRYPLKLDLTQNKIHSLSDQTVKLVKGLKTDVRAVLFAKVQQREQMRSLLDNYKSLSPKFVVEYVDPDKEPTRAKTSGIKKYGTILLQASGRESKVEDATEEKITNALIKLLKEKSPTLCAVVGHGEKSFSSAEADGYQSVKGALSEQAYEVTELNLMTEGKVPDTCSAVIILGPTKSFFAPEVKVIREYLAQGGRAIIALDVNLKGGEYSPELNGILQSWYVKPITALIVDPLSRMLGVDAAVPILATFSKESEITKDFQGNCYFPFARPLEVIAGAPAGMTVHWIAQTTPKSWGVVDLGSIQKGEVAYKPGQDKQGPLTAAVAVEGKHPESKAQRNTRLVVFGSSSFVTNNYSRYGGNLDFFLNAASWVMEDESLISIRPKESGAGKVELSQKQGTTVFLLTVVLLPLLIAAAGIVFWVYRRRL